MKKKKILFTEFVYYAAEAFAHTKTPDKKKLLKEIFHNVKKALKHVNHDVLIIMKEENI